MSNKKFKDPLYGYISIPTGYANRIIDSPAFQRLRRITQTSYAPLYSSAVHNRFIHSLGVYHLGGIASGTLCDEIIRKHIHEDAHLDTDEVKRLGEVFTLACLLHDVGHAPFSHTGESFYLDASSEYSTIHHLLEQVVDSEEFKQDIPIEASESAAPHEIMSAIIGLKEFAGELNNVDEKSFFARCITGYKYSAHNSANSLKNCFISMLNSKIIDVDKLDYLIRDAYITGYNTVKIDYARLLSALTIIKKDDEQEDTYELAYHKGAISVIENVVYAHDSERKWIQNHPVILYECYILQHAMKRLSEIYDTKDGRLFSIEALSSDGIKLNHERQIRLLCDDDVIVLMKENMDDPLIKEYFDRRNRRHPLWKSEAEYYAYIRSLAAEGTMLNGLEEALTNTAKYLKSTMSWIIDPALKERILADLDDIQDKPLDKRTKEIQLKKKKSILQIISCLQDYAEKTGYTGDFVLIMASEFKSSFIKPDFSKTKIVFSSESDRKVCVFKDVAKTVQGEKPNRDEYYYLFYKKQDDDGSIINAEELSWKLFSECARYQ